MTLQEQWKRARVEFFHAQLQLPRVGKITSKGPKQNLGHLCPEGGCGGFIALDPLLCLLEGVHRWSGRICAIWLPLLVLLFRLRPVCWASTISCDVEGLPM